MHTNIHTCIHTYIHYTSGGHDTIFKELKSEIKKLRFIRSLTRVLDFPVPATLPAAPSADTVTSYHAW